MEKEPNFLAQGREEERKKLDLRRKQEARKVDERKGWRQLTLDVARALNRVVVAEVAFTRSRTWADWCKRPNSWRMQWDFEYWTRFFLKWFVSVLPTSGGSGREKGEDCRLPRIKNLFLLPISVFCASVSLFVLPI
jgi:hypothetical protein